MKTAHWSIQWELKPCLLIHSCGLNLHCMCLNREANPRMHCKNLSGKNPCLMTDEGREMLNANIFISKRQVQMKIEYYAKCKLALHVCVHVHVKLQPASGSDAAVHTDGTAASPPFVQCKHALDGHF